MIALWNRISVHTSLLSVIHIGDTNIPFVSFLKNLGVTLDSNLSMSQHTNNTCRTAYIQIRHISSMRQLPTTRATQTLVCSLVLFRLYYCNSLLSRCPQYLLDKLQNVQNAAARLVCRAKKSDIPSPFFKACFGFQWHTVFNTHSQTSASIAFRANPLSIFLILYNRMLHREHYVLHPAPVASSPFV